ncbi:hypothetical protein H2198_002382 [Neophaeococcomyces mojaviensis]|uniref:Uncharacterized protein n=1 Tax=Neophaeococcomyces mojaviensis TaxID=3383035 RepID=A0ACC3AEA5_9EURO|nr:hypothetical protein H2198_002382 [Knufia sp. JES_112]
MARRGEMTEIIPLEDNSSGDSIERPSRIDTAPTYNSRESHNLYPNGRPSLPPAQHHSRYSFVDTPGGSPPGTPLTGGGGASPYGNLVPPRYQSYTTVDTRSSSPSAPTPFRSQDTLRPLFPDAPSTFLKKDWVQDGSIAQLHSRDDAEFWNGWRRHLFYLAPFMTALSLALYWLYFGLRIAFVTSAQKARHTIFPLAWIFITVEICVAIPIFMQNFWTMFSLKKRRRPKLRLIGNDVPTVDVFVTCCGEDDDLVLDTVRAACDVDYPQDKFRVIVLDDGKSASLERAVRDLADTYANLYYKSRPKFPGVPHHFKAGNLNYGLDEVHTMPGGAGQFMAALDADMIPEQQWLRAVLPHLLVDPKMALACPPQLFYNTPPGDPLCQSLDFFVHVCEPIKDALGVAWCTGSGYVVRREALDEIGNFPLGSLAEDVATSTLMLGRGWKTAFVHEPLQFGTVPEDYGSHLKQRTRWAIGTVDTSFKLNFCLWGDKIKQMTFAQRTSSFLYAFLSLFNILLTISLFAMPVVLVAGKPLVAYANNEQLRWLIRSCFAAVISNRLTEFVLFIPSGYHTGQRGSRYQLWMSPYIALCLIRTFVLPTWLGGSAQAFKPTGSLQSALNERDAQRRAPMYRRLWTIVVNYLAGFHLTYVYFTLVAVVLSSYRCFLQLTLKDTLICLITHAFWPPLTFVIVCSSFWIPITYALDPPTVPDRELLLNRDPKTGIAHPTKESKTVAFKGQSAWFELEYTFTTLFTTLIFVCSFLF